MEGTTAEGAKREIRAKAKVCLVGANEGCKTVLVRRHVLDEFDDRYIRTLGAKVTKKRLQMSNVLPRGSIGLDLLVYDILSRPTFRSVLQEAFFQGTSGIVAVADMTRRSTYDELGGWIEAVQDITGPVPVVVIGANRDQVDRQQVSEEDVRRLAQSYGGSCFFAPAGSGEPVEEAFFTLAERIAHRLRHPRLGETANAH